MTDNEDLVVVSDVTKIYGRGNAAVCALSGVNLRVGQGELVALVGPSGSGKTTLLNMLGALDRPTRGEVQVCGRSLQGLNKRQRARLRLESMGFVFQAYNLLPVLTARENVELILELQGVGTERRERAQSMLEELGLGELAERRPNELSGGQQQRVAVARAVASRPRLVLADEPTANLDTANAEGLMEMLAGLRASYGMTFVFSTHDPRVTQHAERLVCLRDGRIQQEAPAVRPYGAVPTTAQPHTAALALPSTRRS